MKKKYLKSASLFVLGISLFSVAYGMDENLSNSSSIERVFTRTPPPVNQIFTKARDALVTEKLTSLLEKNLSSFAVSFSSPKVFISYAWPKRPDEQNIQPFLLTLVNHLKKAGIHPLLDLLDLKPGSHIDIFMEDGIADSHAVLVMGTPTYYTRSQEETNVRYEFIRIAKEASKAISLSYVEEPPVSFLQALISDGHSPLSVHTSENYFLTFPHLIARIYKKAGLTFSLDCWEEYFSSCKTILEAITPEEVLANKDRLEDEAQTFQAAVQQRIADLAENLPFDERFVPQDWLIPFPTSFFGGREILIDQIGQNLKENPKEPFLLHGVHGIGKKQLAFAYAKRFIGRYTFGAVLPDGKVESLLVQLGLTSLEDIKERLSKERWLLICPEVQDLGILQTIVEWGGGHVIATSSEESFEQYHLSVPPLSPESSGEILTHLTGQDLPEVWSDLSQKLNYHPEDLVLFGHYLRQNVTLDPQDLVTYLDEEIKETIRIWSQTAKGFETSLSILPKKIMIPETESLPLKDIVFSYLLSPARETFCKRVAAISFSKSPIWMTFPWTSSQRILLFAKRLFQDLSASGLSLRYELEDRTPSDLTRDYQRAVLKECSYVLLLGTSEFQSLQGQDLLTQISSFLSKSKVLPLIFDGGFGVFPETYKHILMEDVQTPLAYAKAFPRILEIITGLSGNSDFQNLQQDYLADIDACIQGLTEDIIKTRGESFQDQERQMSQDDWLKIKKQAESLGFNIPPRFWDLKDPELKIGRESILQEIERRLDELDPNILRQVVLTGLGGMGKSHLSFRYGALHPTKYNFGFTINAASAETFSLSYRILGETLGLTLPIKDDEMLLLVKGALESSLNSGWLLVLDNADTPDLIKTYLPKRGGGHLLITSRSKDWASDTLLSLDHLERDASIQLMEIRSGLKDRAGANALAQRLGDHPLAMIQAAAYIKENAFLSFEDYLHLLTQSNDLQSALSSTWKITVQKIISDKRVDDLFLVYVMSFLDSEGIPLFFLRDVVEMGWHQKGFSLDHRFGEALYRLQNYSIIETTRQNVSIHQLIQEEIRNSYIDKQGLIDFLLGFMVLEFSEKFKVENPKTWKSCFLLLPHGHALSFHGKEFLAPPETQFRLAKGLREVMVFLGNPKEFLKKSEDCLEIAQQIYDQNHLEVSRSFHWLGKAHQKLGDYKKSLSNQELALDILEKNFPDHSDIPGVLFSISSVYMNLGLLEKSREFEEKYLMMIKRICEPDSLQAVLAL